MFGNYSLKYPQPLYVYTLKKICSLNVLNGVNPLSPGVLDPGSYPAFMFPGRINENFLKYFFYLKPLYLGQILTD